MLIGIVALSASMAVVIHMISVDTRHSKSHLATSLVKLDVFCKKGPYLSAPPAQVNAAVDSLAGPGLFSWAAGEKDFSMKKSGRGAKQEVFLRVDLKARKTKVCMGLLPFTEKELPSHIKIRLPPSLFFGIYLSNGSVMSIFAGYTNQQYADPVSYTSVVSTEVSATHSLFALGHESLNQLANTVVESTGLNKTRMEFFENKDGKHRQK